jgi:hypothetical protein
MGRRILVVSVDVFVFESHFSPYSSYFIGEARKRKERKETNKNGPETAVSGPKLVAGAGFEPAAFRL